MTKMAMTELSVDIVCDAHAGTAEGPLWDERRQELLWTDIPGESIHFTDLASGKDSAVDVGTRVGCVVPRAGGGFAMGACQEFLLCGQDDLAHPDERVRLTEDTSVRVNDGKVDAAGGSGPVRRPTMAAGAPAPYIVSTPNTQRSSCCLG